MHFAESEDRSIVGMLRCVTRPRRTGESEIPVSEGFRPRLMPAFWRGR